MAVLIDNNQNIINSLNFESNLIRRLAGLLYISDTDCGNAKKKALEKIDNANCNN